MCVQKENNWKTTMKMRLSRKAFTLCEILIVIGIIGIISELTIPNLVKNFQEAQEKTAFKKAYSVASQAWAQVVAENPGTFTAKGGWGVCTWSDGSNTNFDANDGRIDFLMSKMRIQKTCINTSGCWPDSYEDDSSHKILGHDSNIPTTFGWVTADGMCWSAPYKNVDEVHLLVDTNCNKLPNKIGQDIFSLMLGADGVVYFAIDDNTTIGKPVSSGLLCPYYSDPATINGRTVSFKSWLYN